MPEVAEGGARRRRRRPRLDGPAVPRRPRLGAQGRRVRADEINTCIACNQACLDHTFAKRTATCLVNPRAATRPSSSSADPSSRRSRSWAGPGRARRGGDGGRARPRGRALRGADDLGGQFGIAMRIPGKEEFAETIRYYRAARPDRRQGAPRPPRRGRGPLAGFDEVVLATGRRAAGPGDPRDRPPEGHDVRRAGPRRRQPVGPRRRDRRGRHRRRRQRVPHHRALARRWTWRPGRPSGVSATRPARARRTHRAAPGAPARSSCCSARPGRSVRASARRPAGCTGPP